MFNILIAAKIATTIQAWYERMERKVKLKKMYH